jgi:hypothetical protein
MKLESPAKCVFPCAKTRALRCAAWFAIAVAATAGPPPGEALAAKVGEVLPREGDEIMVCGQLFHTTAPVVLWTDPGGYDAYRVERRFAPLAKANWKDTAAEVPELLEPNRYSARVDTLKPEEVERIRGGGWDLKTLQKVVDQFVMHYDVCGCSRTCFNVLHDHRGLSVHFMLDVDGTIYQTLDLKERARHATISNNRSIGVEIAQMGAYGSPDDPTLARWYSVDAKGRAMLNPPTPWDKLGVRTRHFRGRPDRLEIITGVIQGTKLNQYDFTPQQYDSLIKLTATLCQIFPRLKCRYPVDDGGQLIPHKLDDADLKQFGGILGHYHIQTNKTDPGPAFNWEKVVGGAQKLLD